MSRSKFSCLAIVTTAVVLGIVFATHEVYGWPKALGLTLGLPFLVWSCIYWPLRWQRSPRAGICVLELLLSWSLVTSLVLGMVYEVDRAGWLWFQLTGYDVALAEDLTNRLDVPLVDFVDHNPAFKIDGQDPNRLILPQGDYTIDETIVIPKGVQLTIDPGTVIRMAAGCSIISYMPIDARGTESAPILFTAKNAWLKWGTVAVVDAAPSSFEYATFEHGRRAFVNDVDFPGGLSVIDSDVELRHCRFLNMCGKDAAYVRNGRVLIRDNIFRSAPNDGLDLDGGSGDVTQNLFVNCDDEGIDLSANQEIRVFDNTIQDRRGGRIAAEQNPDDYRRQNTLEYSPAGKDSAS